jgi:hypothetical protein
MRNKSGKGACPSRRIFHHGARSAYQTPALILPMNTTKTFASSILYRFFWAICALISLGLPGIGLAITPGKFRDPATLQEITLSSEWKNLIVVTHGWNPDSGISNKFAEGFWPDLAERLTSAVSGSDWRVVLYDWTLDASTGSALEGTFGIPATGIKNATLAALNADEHAAVAASVISSKCTNLRQIHFISHSAGSWLTRRALVNTLAANPLLVGQMTLLDAFVPGELSSPSPFYANAYKLSKESMEQLRYMGLLKRLYRLDNYYVKDLVTFATDVDFSWWPTDLGGIRVDTNGNYYQNQPGFDTVNQHSVPVLFYADTVDFGDYVQRTGLSQGVTPSGGSGARLANISNPAGGFYDSRSLGWFQSLFYQRNIRPNFSTQMPASLSVVRNQPLTLSVAAQNATTYKWLFKAPQANWVTLPNAISPSIIWATATDSLSGQYAVEISGPNGILYSDACAVSVTDTPPVPTNPASRPNPILTSVSPTSFSSSVQTLILSGSNFLPSDELNIEDPNGTTYSSLTYPDRFAWQSSNRIDYRVNVGSLTGQWKIRIASTPNSSASAYRNFTVTAPPPVAPPTATTGSLQVSLSPSSAIGAQWSVSGRVSRNSGETEPGLPPGTATVRFTPVSGYNTPADRTVTITAGNTASTSATYTAVAPANYTLTLNSVNGAIGRNPDASSYPAGTVVRIWASANSGYHFVNWSGDLSGSSTVADIVMTGNKNITAIFAAGDWSKTSLAVSILPAEVLTLGAQWRVDGGSWRNSGVIIPDQHLGDNVVEFREVPGWYKPATQRIILQGGQPAVISGTYTRDVTPGILQVAINPPDAAAAGGQWQVNGGAWQSHAASLSLAPGSYTVSFKPVATWGTPPSRTVVVPNGATANVNASYEVPLGQPTIFSVSPLFGPIAGGTILTIDGANFGRNSTVTIGGVAAASVTVIDSTQVLATTPAAVSTGTAPIVVTSGAVSAPSNAFSYSASQGAGMQLLSSIGGTSMAVASNANNVFIGEGANLVVTSTNDTARLGSVLIPGLIQDISLFTRSGRNYVCIAANAAGLQIVDVTTPTSPVLVSNVAINGTASGVAISGTLAYVSAYEGRLMIVDLSAPTAPIKRSELVMTQGASDVAVRTSVAGVFCYMPSGTDLLVVQADLPTAPTFLRSISGPTADLFDSKRTIAISGAGAYVSLNGGISVFDLSSSAFPTFVQYKTGLNNNAGGALAAAGGYLYEATRGWGISTYSISTSGISLLHYTPSIACDSGNGISVSSNKAFVAGGDSGTNYFSLSSPTAPTLTWNKPVSGTCWAVDVSDSLAITACNLNGATIYDVSAPQNPLMTAMRVSPSPGFQLYDVKLRGRNGYLRYSSNSKFHYLNLTNPAAPVNSGSFDYVTYSPNAFDVVDNRVFLAGGGPNYSAGAKLGIINGGFGSTSISSDFSVFPGGWVRSVSGFGNVAVIGIEAQGAKFVHVGNGTLFSSVRPGETIQFTNFSPNGEYCYLGSSSAFYIYDVRNPSVPIKVFETPASYPRISSSGSKVAFTSDKLVKVFDVTNPASPVQVASQSCLDYTTGIKISGDLVYVANYEAGMSIYRLNDAISPEVFITNPVFASTYETGDAQIDIAGEVYDDRQLASIGWSNDTGGGAAGTFSLANWQIDGIPLRVGPNEITVTAVDTSGNVGRDTITVFRSGVKQSQTLTFIAPPIQTFGGPPLPLVATSSSALPVTFSIVSGPASIVGSTLTTSGVGTVVVRATQAGNWDYSAATPVDRSFTVDKSPQLIAWTAIGDKIYGDPTFTLSAQATSGQAVTYSVVSGPATVAGTQCTLTGQGVVVLNASLAGSANYLPASENISFSVFGTPQTLSFGTLAQQVVGASAFPLVAVSSSGQPVTYSVLSGPAELIEGKLHLIGPGVVIVRAYAPGTNSLASATVDQMFAVVPGVNLISDFQKMENDRTYFRFWGEQNRDYDIQSSPDLKIWTTLSTERVNSFGYIEHTGEPVGTTPKAFYRVKW